MTQKMVITKNRVTSKILFRFTQNFSYIRSSLCSKLSPKFQVFTTKTLCFTGVQKMCLKPSTVQNLPSTWTYRLVLIVMDRSLSPSNQNGPMMPCLEMATQAVHFTECNSLCRQCSGGVLHQKMLFLKFTWPDNRKCASSNNQTLSIKLRG